MNIRYFETTADDASEESSRKRAFERLEGLVNSFITHPRIKSLSVDTKVTPLDFGNGLYVIYTAQVVYEVSQ